MQEPGFSYFEKRVNIMKVLLDTNIFIYREDDHVISENLQELLRILSATKADIIIHPSSIEDLQRDSNERRKDIMSSKLKAYPFLESPPNPDEDTLYLELVNIGTKNNDKIDNKILYSIYKDAADFLITEDRRIHKKAGKLGMNERILLIDEAIQIFKSYIHREKVIAPPALKNEVVYNLSYEDPIFDSLKEEYHPEFSDWFKKISREGRKSWVYYRNNGSIGAILIYKFEDEAIGDARPPLPKAKRLKIALMKVTYNGYKIGELFIKMAVDLAIKNDIYEIYLTHFTTPEDQLVELITDYGFDKVAVRPKGEKLEDVYVKKLAIDCKVTSPLSPLEISRRFYPSFYDGEDVKKFIVPIRPEYHDKLFTDFPGRQPTLMEFAGEFIVEGNTIKKAYLSHSRIRKIEPGDILLFYRSEDLQAITSIGVIERVYSGINDSDKILRLVGKRTVFSKEEVDTMVKDPVSIFLFQHHFHIKRPIRLDELADKGILSSWPQSITEISHTNYIKLKRMSGINERFTVH